MSLIVAITGAAGFLASYLLLSVGLSEMWIRYLLVFVVAYAIFLFFLWLWLRTKARDYSDIPDLFQTSPSNSGGGCDATPVSGQGGNFGGGGASSSYSHPVEASYVEPPAVAAEEGGVAGETLGAAASADEAAIPLLVLAVLGALFVCSFWVIYTAPVFFAELLLDGALVTGLYRHLRKTEYKHWLETAIGRTLWPFILTTVIVVAIAWGMKFYAPEAHSLGEVILHYRHAK